MFTLFCGVTPLASAQEKDPLPAGEGKETVQKVCSGCHDLQTAVEEKRTEEDWKSVVTQMIASGAKATDAERDIIVKYLAKNFAK